MLPVISQKETLKINTDVLVIGAGLAGIMAAISAAEAGAKVTLASSGATCSGSSFYPGTWGFGLVGPENEEDEKDLVDTIMRVGCQMPYRELAETFVSRINEGIAYLEKLGVPLKKADNPREREFIPCFDHKCRSWHGIVKEDAKPVFLTCLNALGVRLMPYTEATELMLDAPAPAGRPSRGKAAAAARVIGAVAVRDGEKRVELFSKSTVIATGGLGGLYRHRLNPGDVSGMGQYLALSAGAKLVNLEFMQMMPGFLSPAYGTVFNEKIFRYTRSAAYGGWSREEREELLELRSGHGPYSSRLKSGRVDEALADAWAKTPEGVLVSYGPELKTDQPEFVRTYFEWLEREKHLTVDDPVRLGIFAHASNGGIRIDQEGFTGVPGLYACGEATGGMHGADRLGGLSTANGLVFGRLAGKAAAAAAGGGASDAGSDAAAGAAAMEPEGEALPGRPKGMALRTDEQAILAAVKETRMQLRERMGACAMIGRSEARGREMADWLRGMEELWRLKPLKEKPLKLYLEGCHLKAELAMAACMVQAIRLRKESRGSHHREDYPEENPSYARRIIADQYGICMEIAP